MRLYDETCLALCEGQYIDIATSATRRADDGRALLRHDRPQDRGAHRRRRSRPARCWPPTTRPSSPRYRGFGWALGLAFQLNDDLLGIWGQEQATGKEPSDVARRKKTLPVLYAFEHARRPIASGCRAVRARPRPTTDEVAEIVAILERLGCAGLHAVPRRAATGTRPRRSSMRSPVVEPAAREKLERGSSRHASSARSGDHAHRRARRAGRRASRRRRPTRPRSAADSSSTRALAHDQHLADATPVGRLDREPEPVDADLVARPRDAADPVVDEAADGVVLVLVLELRA